MKKSDELRKAEAQTAAKRPYDKPRLTVYGDLRLRTWGMLTGPLMDGGPLGLTHTG
jgi:hypothetical protein